MIDSSPRPLPQHRLEKLVHGIRQRMDGSMQQTAVKVRELEASITEHGTQFQSAMEALESRLAHQSQLSTTEWDEEIQGCWDNAEKMSYAAVFETAAQEKQLKATTEQLINEATAEAKKKISEVEKRFMRAKEKPLAKLRVFRTNNENAKKQLETIETAAESAITQRSLRIPKTETSSPPVSIPESSESALLRLQETIAAAETHCDRIANNPLAKFFDSIWWWGFCALVFVGTVAGLIVSQTVDPIQSVLYGSGATVGVLLLGFVGIRPWLKRAAANEYPKMMQAITEGQHLHAQGEELAVQENDTELNRLAEIRDGQYLKIKNWRDERADELTQKLSNDLNELHQKAAAQKVEARDGLTTELEDTSNRFHNRMTAEEVSGRNQKQQLESELQSNCDQIRSEINRLNDSGVRRMQIATQKALQVITRSHRWCNEHFPAWEQIDGAKSKKLEVESKSEWPESLSDPILPVGSLAVGDFLPDESDVELSVSQLDAPVLFSPLLDEYLVIHGDTKEYATQDMVRNLVMRALTTLPPGRTQVCVIDPPGLGRDFGWLMHLGDFDPQLVSHRVWTQPSHISKQLSALTGAAEDFIQQSLRNEYRNIVEYNQEAGALAEPYRILIWSCFPSAMDDHSWKQLSSLLDSGAKCGIVPILIVEPDAQWPSSEQEKLLERRGLHLTLTEDKRFIANSKALSDMKIEPAEAPSVEHAQRIVQEVGRRALLSNRVEVPLEKMLPEAQNRWQADSSNFLEVPIGQSGVGRMHALKLGVGTAQHAIIAGKTGSGKSSLLHAMITSALLKYSPEALRVVLLDFKKGVEFQVYSEAQIPHADIIGIESHREFGLSALEYIDSCMQRRGEDFRKSGVQDIASWNALHPENPIPRMLLVIDEFQEIFVEDDKLAQQAGLILDRIVRQGRSFGVHAVLSSQTLAGAYSLPRTTLGQMAVRIALQCDPSDAQIIFAEDNPAASRLKHPGQAIYNDTGGRIEGNQPMQIGWMTKQEQVSWFGELESGYRNADPTTNRLGRTVIFDGNRAATWSHENANLAVQQATAEVNPEACWCVAGESVAINPAVVFPLTEQAGRNVLIVGGNDAQAASVINTVTCSTLAYAKQANKSAQVFAIQGAKPTDAKALAMTKAWQALDADIEVVDVRRTEEIIDKVHQIVQKRTDSSASFSADSDAGQDFEADGIVLLDLIQISRMRELRKDDDFGMGGFGEEAMKPDKKLEEILRDGPSCGVHTLIWAESYSTVNRWLSRSAFREMELRLLMQMSGNDSTNLVDSVAASKLGDHVMLLYDEASGQEHRFRPFDNDTLQTLPSWIE